MKKFEYDITFHPVETLGASAFVCSEQGVCSGAKIRPDFTDTLKQILGEKGRDGWELVQLEMGTSGVLAFWKKQAPENNGY